MKNDFEALMERFRKANRSDAWTLEEATIMLFFGWASNAVKSGKTLDTDECSEVIQSSYDFLLEGVQKEELHFIDKCKESAFTEMVGVVLCTASASVNAPSFNEAMAKIKRGIKVLFSIPPHRARALTRFRAAKTEKDNILSMCLDSLEVRRYAEANGRGTGIGQAGIAAIVNRAKERTNLGAIGTWAPRDELLKQAIEFMTELIGPEIGCKCRHNKLAAIAYAYATDKDGVLLQSYDTEQFGLKNAFKDCAYKVVPPERQFGFSTYKPEACKCPITDHQKFKMPTKQNQRYDLPSEVK